MLRFPSRSLGILQRLVIPPLPIWHTPRAFYAAPAKGEASTATGAANKKSVRDAPVAISNIGRKWFDKNWKKRQRLAQIEAKKKAMKRKDKWRAVQAKKTGQQVVQKKSPKKLQRGENQSLQAIQKYDREDQRKKRKEDRESEEGDIRDGDFLFQYARFNLGEQALNKVVSVHIREAMWQLYDADSVCPSPTLSPIRCSPSLNELNVPPS